MLEIKKIRIKELAGFITSEMFQQFSIVPVTPARVNSYLQNPAAKPDDVVLYLGFQEEKLVAFRSLFADYVFSGKEHIRFAWCSGNWVYPGFRRNGFSEILLKEAFNDWNGKLMFTNYATASEQLYLKTGWFQSIHKFDGVRAYLFPKTRKLISVSEKNGISKFIFSIIDFSIAVLSAFRLLFYRKKVNNDFRFEIIEFPDSKCFETVQNNKLKSRFKRGELELKWIFENPWISTKDKTFEKKYPFSSFSKTFFYRTVKVFKANQYQGFFIFSVRNGHLKTLYFNGLEMFENEIAGFLKNYCVENRIEIVTIYNKQIADVFFQQKFPFLRLKKFGQNIYSSFEIQEDNSLAFQDGDGDVFFT